MAKKITDLTALTSVATGDLLEIVDISDTTDSAAGSSRKIAQDNLIPDSSATVKGKVELATDAETETGTDTDRATTPANVASAYTKESATDISGAGYFIDEDDMSTNSATKVPSQQSVKAYTDTTVAGIDYTDLRMFAYRTTSSQAITGGSAATIVFNAESYDTGGDYNASNGIYTVPSDGLYFMSSCLTFGVGASGDKIHLNMHAGGSEIGGSVLEAGGAEAHQVTFSTVRYLSTSDTIYVQALNDNNDDTVNAGLGLSNFCVQKLF